MDKVKILIVDDEQDALDATAAMLDREFEVLKAGGRPASIIARRLWEKHSDVQLAVVDLFMPDERKQTSSEEVGLRLIEEMKSQRPDARIAVGSGVQTHENLARAIAVGADAFIGKDWPRSRVLANIKFMGAWITSGSALRALSATIYAAAAHGQQRALRVREFCRRIIVHLNDATPQEFDLAACMAAAELHDFGGYRLLGDDPIGGGNAEMRERRFERMSLQVKYAHTLKELGDEFNKVSEILSLRRRCYRRPRSSWLIDFPPDEDAPRESGIPLETRVLSVACAFDTLLAPWPYGLALSLGDALRRIRDGANLEKFDAKVVNALKDAADRDELKRITHETPYPDVSRMKLRFPGKRLTAGQLQRILDSLSSYLTEWGTHLALNSLEQEETSFLIDITSTQEGIRRIVDGLRRQRQLRDAYYEQYGKMPLELTDICDSYFETTPSEIIEETRTHS